MTDWRQYAEELADALVRYGALDPGWREAFAAVPRHLFVPSFYGDDGRLITADTPDALAAVYADESLVTQVAPDPAGGFTWPTSSSTRPSLMARMLALLDVRDGSTVLEIGTGTGYNAALLCHRLGDAHVNTVDIDPELVERAAERLAQLGYRPRLVVGDGAAGVPDAAPFDRIIATAAIVGIPPAWIRQLNTGGTIVADLRGELASALVVAEKTAPDAVRGRFNDTAGHFMWLRARADHPLRGGRDAASAFDFTQPQATTTDIPGEAFSRRAFRFLLQLAVPGLGPIGAHLPDGSEGIFLYAEDDCSWVAYRPGRQEATVTHGGPRNLWPAIEATWRQWTGRGEPGVGRLGITAYDDGRHEIWLDHDQAILLVAEPVTS